LKPSTRQRFVTLSFGYPAPDVELEILQQETGVDARAGRALVAVLEKLRSADTLVLAAAPSTRLGVSAARLIQEGVAPRAACTAAIIEPLTDDAEIASGLRDLVALAF
jgi:nitric oxide reductase NorQ protein